MLSKILAKAALKAHKFQADFFFETLSMSSSNPSSRISLSIKSGPQSLESLQRPKANYETELNESLTLMTSIFFEEFKHKYQEKFIQIELFLHTGQSSHCIGLGRIDLAQFAVLALEKPYTNDIILVMEKSAEHQAKITMKLGLKYIGEEENSSVLLNKIKNSTQSPLKSQVKNSSEKSPKKEISIKKAILAIIPKKSQRSLTPTPKSSISQPKSAIDPRIPKENRVLDRLIDRSRSKSGNNKDIVRKNENNFGKIANTVLLMKNSITTIVRKSSKSPAPIREKFKKLVVPGPLFSNKYSSVYDEKISFEGKIKEVKEAKDGLEEKIKEVAQGLEKNDGDCEGIMQKIKEFEMKNCKLRKDIEKNRNELKKTKENILKNLEEKPEKTDEKNFEKASGKKKNDLFEKIDEFEKIEEFEKIDEKNGENAEISKEKLEEFRVDFERLSLEKASLQNEMNVLKVSNNDLLKNIVDFKRKHEEIDAKIEEMNKKQMDLKNEYLNLNSKQPNSFNKSKINDLFSDSYKKFKEFEVQTLNLQKEIVDKNEEIIANENKFFEYEGIIEELKVKIPEITEEQKELLKKIDFEELNIKKLCEELQGKEKKKIEVMEETIAHQDGYVKTKQNIADIFNLVFEKGGDELMDELEKFL